MKVVVSQERNVDDWQFYDDGNGETMKYVLEPTNSTPYIYIIDFSLLGKRSVSTT